MAIDSAALGTRIAQARVEAGFTQADLASAAGLERTALAKMETGVRGVSAIELAGIASAVRQRLEWFLTDGPPAVVSHRVRRGSDSQVAAIDRELERLATDVEFVTEQTGALAPSAPDPWEVPTSLSGADAMAERARHELGVAADIPLLNLPEVFSAVGLYIFASALGADTADGGTVLLRKGGVSLINATSELGRRRLTAAHELAHFLVADEYTVDWRTAEARSTDRIEAIFDRFARALLLPEHALTTYWRSAIEEGVRAAAVRTASTFRVDMSTLSRRLLETGNLGQEDADRVRTTRTTQADILEYGLLVPFELEDRTIPSAYERAVLTLYRGERVSQERALDLLRGKYGPEDLPDLAPAREDELWSILS